MGNLLGRMKCDEMKQTQSFVCVQQGRNSVYKILQGVFKRVQKVREQNIVRENER